MLGHLVTVMQHVPFSRRRSCAAAAPSCGAPPLLLQSVRRAPGVCKPIQDATRVPSAPVPPVMSHDPAMTADNRHDLLIQEQQMTYSQKQVVDKEPW